MNAHSDELSTRYIIIWLHQHEVNTSSFGTNAKTYPEKTNMKDMHDSVATFYASYVHLRAFNCMHFNICVHICLMFIYTCIVHISYSVLVWLGCGFVLHAKKKNMSVHFRRERLNKSQNFDDFSRSRSNALLSDLNLIQTVPIFFSLKLSYVNGINS